MTKCASSCLNRLGAEANSIVQSDRCAGANPRRANRGSIGLALGIPVALTICVVILATALPLSIRTIRIDRREEEAMD